MQHRSYRVLAASLILTLLVGAMFAPIALGQDMTATTAEGTPAPTKSFEFFPAGTDFGSYFQPTIEAGSSAKLTALIANTGEVVQDIRTYANNGFTGDGGGFGAAPYGTPPNDVTSWLDYPEDTFTIAPGKGIERTFTITVPDGTHPGEYITSVAAEEADVTEIPGSNNLTQRLRYVVPVIITVPGEMTPSFEVNDIKMSLEENAVIISVGIANTGDLRVHPEGSIELLDQSGTLLVSFPVKMQAVFAHDATTYAVGTLTPLPPGPYTVRVNLSDAETGTTAKAEQSGLEAAAAATPVAQQVIISAATATPKPAADNVQFAEVAATIVNSGVPITNAQLSLVASKDGAEVERFPISQSLSLPTGETPVTTRYIPAEGWSSGTWTFELLVETVDPSGAAVVMARLPVDGTITIP